jgi:hypothetical protein
VGRSRGVTTSSDPSPRTLREAHEVLVRRRPTGDAPLSAWQEFHDLSARVYAELAEVDRGHHHEALYWATRERQSAQEIAGQMSRGDAVRSQTRDGF